MAWNVNEVLRTTKCLGPQTNGYPGGFPVGFIQYIKDLGYWGVDRCYLCCGNVIDPDAVRVDVKPEVNPTHLEDASNTSLPPDKFDVVIIDPPYSEDLADSLYGTKDQYHGINAFLKEGARITKPGGLIVTLSYEIPKQPDKCNLIAMIGLYQLFNNSKMRALTVWKKEGIADQRNTLLAYMNTDIESPEGRQ
jgi:hypothetical protein